MHYELNKVGSFRVLHFMEKAFSAIASITPFSLRACTGHTFTQRMQVMQRSSLVLFGASTGIAFTGQLATQIPQAVQALLAFGLNCTPLNSQYGILPLTTSFFSSLKLSIL